MTGFIELDISQLVECDWNYKMDDAAKQAKLVNNIRRNGQIENIIVRPLANGSYEVVNGNHRLKAFRELGLNSVMAFNLGDISLAAAQRIAYETNESRFENDPASVDALIRAVSEEFSIDDLLSTMDAPSLELGSSFDFDFEPEKDDAPAEQEEKFKTFKLRLPESVYEVWSDALARVGDSIGDDNKIHVIEALAALVLNTPPNALKIAILGRD